MACGRPLLVRGIRTLRFKNSTLSHRRWKRLPRRKPVCTDRRIFSARSGDVAIVFAALMRRLYSSSVRWRSRELSSLKNLTRETGFEAARLRAMHQLKNAFKTATSLPTVGCATDCARRSLTSSTSAVVTFASNVLGLICASHTESAGSTYERCERFWTVEYSRYSFRALSNVTLFGVCSCQVPFSIFVCSADQTRIASRSRRKRFRTREPSG